MPPESEPTGAAGAPAFQLDPLEDPHGGRPFGLTVDDSGAAELVEVREAHVLDDRPAEQESLVLARLGDHGKAVAQAGKRTGPSETPSGKLDRAVCAAIGAEDRTSQLGATRADESGDADDLSLADFKAHVLDAWSRHVAHRQRRGSVHGAVGLLRERCSQRPTEHRLDQRVLGLLRRRGGADQPTVTQDRDRVRKLEHLTQDVRDEQYRLAVLSERPDDLVQPGRVRPAERGRRLVHHEQASIPRERAENLDLLLLGDPKLSDRSICRKLEPGLCRQLLEALAQGSAPHPAGASRLGAEKHVRGNRHSGHDQQLLCDRRDPVRERVSWRAKRNRLPVE